MAGAPSRSSGMTYADRPLTFVLPLFVGAITSSEAAVWKVLYWLSSSTHPGTL